MGRMVVGEVVERIGVIEGFLVGDDVVGRMVVGEVVDGIGATEGFLVGRMVVGGVVDRTVDKVVGDAVENGDDDVVGGFDALDA